jgi:small subunit ribosomal protein S6
MRAYELMIIFDGDLDDSRVQLFLNRITALIEAEGGDVVNVDKWGRRKFAYEINHKQEGIYVVLEWVVDAMDNPAFERVLRLADEVVRHKLLRLPEAEAERRGLFGSTTPAT